ncbi:hypothetical protein KC19_3G238800 [Ceratodon purpureus]|uniref:Protein kinase domain-containing protein n=1 Tax=Ceratodon purpureus TaxID=3225 RepID=A0A8T0IPB3_CERPU|nr:hypothetical protein KC19_3G238800 [Ceratodon purpureus]
MATRPKVWASFGSFVVVAVMEVLLCSRPVLTEDVTYFPEQLEAFKVLAQNWSQTPDRDVNLPGWYSNVDPSPCSLDGAKTKWGGVECLNDDDEDGGGIVIRMIGLTLSDASIVGGLPPAIGNFTPFLSLTVTGNPDLSGDIPVELAELSESLNTLDLHDNALGGQFPAEIDFSTFYNLRSLDLSGNQISGQFPFQLQNSSPVLTTLNLAGNRFEGNIPMNTTANMPNLVTLDLSKNLFSGPFPTLDFSHKSSIKYVNLSRNNFTPKALSDLPLSFKNNVSSSLRMLDLSGNNINGSADALVPFLHKLGSQLEELYLDDNNITGALSLDDLLGIRDDQKLSRFQTVINLTNNDIQEVSFASNIMYYTSDIYIILRFIRLDGNPFCKSNAEPVYSTAGFSRRCFCEQNCTLYPVLQPQSKSHVAAIAAATTVPSVIVVALIGAFLLYRSRRKQKYLLLQVQRMCDEYDVKPTIFTYNELRNATRDFHPDMKLGEGGYGAVFKGVLANTNLVAVKQLHMNSQQGIGEFLNEVALISGMKHRNLVKLKGCCLREKQRLLVYEYVDNHDLEWHLLEDRSNELLSWPKRLGICLGVANGLHYLHALAQPKIIHRDIKAANILLDNNLEPKIADFGLALLFPEETSHIMTLHIAGTKGYLAPEYASFGQLSEKADVYSFGVLCLEIISGRKNIDNDKPLDQVILSNWAQELHSKGNMFGVLDSRLNSLTETEVVEVQRVLCTALLCIQHSQELRPTMARVVSLLHGDSSSDVTILEPTERYAPHAFAGAPGIEMAQLDLKTVNEDNGVAPLFRAQGGVSFNNMDSICSPLSEVMGGR